MTRHTRARRVIARLAKVLRHMGDRPGAVALVGRPYAGARGLASIHRASQLLHVAVENAFHRKDEPLLRDLIAHRVAVRLWNPVREVA